ncbi:MAG TPA: hypothetical protein VEI27_01095 [Dehalococcoidales bacterium]|nr:hypothetical protein [Dehalococcoidales bacterium]
MSALWGMLLATGNISSEGRAKMHVLVAVSRKLLSTRYSMLKTGTTYDPNWEGHRRFAPARP